MPNFANWAWNQAISSNVCAIILIVDIVVSLVFLTAGLLKKKNN